MMRSNVFDAYRQTSVHCASPVGLVVMLYDSALSSLYQAMKAIETGNIEERTNALNHVTRIVCHLQGTLDLEAGGEVAKTLSDFYTYARARILEAGIKNSRSHIAELSLHMSELRNAWLQVDSTALLQ